MILPTYEDISIGKTKGFVSRKDIENFDSWARSLDDIVKPFEKRAKECDTKNMIVEGHTIETTIERLNEEIIRLVRWAKIDQKPDIERLAKEFKDTKDIYLNSRDALEYHCKCEPR